MLITLEGIDGSGKSTQAKKLYEYLRNLGYAVSLYREPGGTPLAEQVRKVLFSHEVDPITELFLFATARASLMHEKVLPDLRAGKIVILDRFTDSTLAYQGYGKGVNVELIEAVNTHTTSGIKPALTFLLDLPAEEALERIRRNRNRFEELGFLNKVRGGYLQIAQKEAERVKVINAMQEEEAVFQQVLRELYSDHFFTAT